jgi:MSHA pilin protein MshC
MSSSSSQIEVIARNVKFRLCAGIAQGGFTLIELIMVLVIVGILAIAVIPRLFNNSDFQSRGFADQVQASLRYAQKEAIAQHRNVCVTFTLPAPSTIMLRIANFSGAASACDTNLISPSTGLAYVITAPAGIAFAALPTAFSFDALGRPNPGALLPISIPGATNSITIEAETGYVHSP